MPTTTSSQDDSLDDDTLAADLLRGAEAIGRFIGVDQRAAYHLLESGHVPARRVGGVWVYTKSGLRAFFATPTNITSTDTDNDTAVESPPTPRSARAARSAPRRAARSAKR
jgi:hypothetical protein